MQRLISLCVLPSLLLTVCSHDRPVTSERRSEYYQLLWRKSMREMEQHFKRRYHRPMRKSKLLTE